MTAKLVVASVFLIYYLGYRFYAGFLARRIFRLRSDFPTPAHTLKDGNDYVPTPPFVLFGHHYASIAGLGPILGPSVAVIWGWLPALLWVVLGTLFVGAVHDFAALVLSVRARGLSIGSITEQLLGRRARLMFLLMIFFLVALAMGVFVLVLSQMFGPTGFPVVVSPSIVIMIVAIGMGFLSYRAGVPLKFLFVPSFAVVLMSVLYADTNLLRSLLPFHDQSFAPDTKAWKYILLTYGFIASVLPVWLLLQSRDFLNSLLLYLGMLTLIVGFFLADVEFAAPAFVADPVNAPPVFPFVFIIIACGALSGFHALVSSGTTAKQLNRETDARYIGYGGMVGESVLGLIAVLATTTAISGSGWNPIYNDYKAVANPEIMTFVRGGAEFLTATGLDRDFSTGFLALLVVSFALTSLDSATRLLRYNIQEISDFLPGKLIRKTVRNIFLSSALAVAAIGFFAFFEINGKPAGKTLWQVFGTSNQLLGALTLMLASVYLYSRGINPVYTLVPMIFVTLTTIGAMLYNLQDFLSQRTPALVVTGTALIIGAVWLLIEGFLSVRRYTTGKSTSLDL